MYFSTPTLTHHSQLARSITDLRTQLSRSSEEMVTGRKSDPLRAARGDQETLLRSRTALDAAESDGARLKVLAGRYRVAGSSLRTVSELGQGVIGAALTAADDSAGIGAQRFAEAEARTAIASALGSFEARFGGRALFGGTLGSGQVTNGFTALESEIDTAIGGETSAAGIQDAIENVFSTGGAYENNVYRGAGQAADAELIDGLSIGALPSASSEPVRDMLSGMSMVLKVREVNVGEREGFLQEAAEIMQRAFEDLIAEEAAIGLSSQAIEREELDLERRIFDAEASLEAVLGRDPFEAASETQSLEARLQAAYTVTGRLGSLRLTNYLR